MTEFTQWFPATTKPEAEGEYPTRCTWVAGEMDLYWDGEFWRASKESPRKPWTQFSPREWRLPSPVAKCWSCNHPYTLERRAEADGNCPHCGVEIELDDDTSASPVVAA